MTAPATASPKRSIHGISNFLAPACALDTSTTIVAIVAVS